jgi:hypothetical protein
MLPQKHMSEELVLAGLRVLSCYTFLPRRRPDAEDLERLRQAVTAEKRDWNGDELATYIIERELRQRKSMAAAESK